mmetsp:Transcript_6186/g.11054  ORF Transcript_6186/g.11054 Transcript_6186/m.11054 type:complete len:80 (+) Transcript_6186:445-684(+)
MFPCRRRLLHLHFGGRRPLVQKGWVAARYFELIEKDEDVDQNVEGPDIGGSTYFDVTPGLGGRRKALIRIAWTEAPRHR